MTGTYFWGSGQVDLSLSQFGYDLFWCGSSSSCHF